MAPSGRNSVPALQLGVCSVVLLFLLLADVTAALDPHQRQETGVNIVASTEAFYLRGNPTVKVDKATEEGEESYESFERRELADDGYQESSANCSANCDVKP